jgi:uncharacterized protein
VVPQNTKPLPHPDADSRPFWEGCGRGELLLQHCTACGALRHPPAALCARCHSDAHEWRPASGRGSVHSFVVVHHAFHPAWEGSLPYVVATVALEEGPHLVTNIVGAPIEQVRIGLPVEVCFEATSTGLGLALFRPSAS